MWLLISRFLLIGLGVLIGVVLMCLMQISKQADKQLEEIQRRNEIWTKSLQLVFKPRPITGTTRYCGDWSVLRLQA